MQSYVSSVHAPVISAPSAAYSSSPLYSTSVLPVSHATSVAPAVSYPAMTYPSFASSASLGSNPLAGALSAALQHHDIPAGWILSGLTKTSTVEIEKLTVVYSVAFSKAPDAGKPSSLPPLSTDTPAVPPNYVAMEGKFDFKKEDAKHTYNYTLVYKPLK